jgi:hypothetical protein
VTTVHIEVADVQLSEPCSGRVTLVMSARRRECTPLTNGNVRTVVVPSPNSPLKSTGATGMGGIGVRA